VAASDMSALLTRRDAAPLALIEAMAGGLAALTTEVGDIPEIVGPAGVVVAPPSVPAAPEEVSAIAAALSALAADASGRRRLGELARGRAEARHREESMVARYDELLRSLL